MRCALVLLLGLAGCQPATPPSGQPAPAPPTIGTTSGEPRPAASVPAEALPQVPPGRWELHGTFHGDRFWARLKTAEKRFAGKRLLMLLYTQPDRKDLDGAVLADHPFLAVDDHLRIFGWNERGDNLGRADYSAKTNAYTVIRELERVVDGETHAIEEKPPRILANPPAWDLRLAPILLALAWRAGTKAEVPLVDLFGPKPAGRLLWRDDGVDLAGTVYRIESDAEGRLAVLRDAANREVLRVAGWLTAAEKKP